ncbi:MAG: ice-binding family protein [Myxococcota bacterium]|nr:ice-binding family protein [Myxococcota bacterium]
MTFSIVSGATFFVMAACSSNSPANNNADASGSGGGSGSGSSSGGTASSSSGTGSSSGGTASGSSTSSGGGSGGGSPHDGGAGPCTSPAVNVLSAANFAVLAGSTVTNVGMTTVTGDLGVSPGTAVTGFPPGTSTGMVRTDAVSAQAAADLTTAYNDAAGRTLCPVSVAGNLGGQTLAPGLYKSTSSLEISSGDLTLDAQGDAAAVWIFQIASTLTTTSGRKIVLAGGAQAKNIFWQVGTAASIGTTSVIQGTIMADQAITMATGATLNGRALAHSGAVALDTNAIVKP